VPGDLIIKNCKLGGNVDFSQSSVGKSISIETTNFAGSMSFKGSTCNQTLDMKDSGFCGTVNLDGSTIKRNISIDTCGFRGNLSFNGTMIQDSVVVKSSSVGGVTSMQFGAVPGLFEIANTTFHGLLSFQGTTFQRRFIYRAGNEKGVNFTECKFNETAEFSGFVEHTLHLPTTTMTTEKARNLVLSPETTFTTAKLDQSLGNVPDGPVYLAFSGKSSLDRVEFYDPAHTRFQLADFSQPKVMGTNFSGVVFSDVKWALIEGTRKGLYDELVALGDAQGKKQKSATRRLLETSYRGLRKVLEESGNHADANDFYYGESKFKLDRYEEEGNARRWILRLYKSLSGFGTRPLRAASMLALLLFVYAIIGHSIVAN